MRNVVVGGSSITNTDPWPTWATWLQKRYDAHFIDVSVKGLGNEAIITKAVSQARMLDDPVLIVQLTNVDKWDWYVENTALIQQMNQEKHQITKISPEDTAGFWGTGSHFPKWKAHYQEHYFGLQYQMWHTLLLINWLQMVCHSQQWNLYVIFDSPLLAVTEQQLNQGMLSAQECGSRNLTDNTLCRLVHDCIDWSDIYCPGLIGFAVLKDMPWFSEKNKGHPGSLVHWMFTQEVLVPVLDRWLRACHDLNLCRGEAQRMQDIFHAIR